MSANRFRSKPSRRLFAVAVMSVLAVVVLTGCIPAAPAPGLVTEINAQRAAVGAGPLAMDDGLTAIAGKWASGLAFIGKLNHQNLSKLTGWNARGETLLQGFCGQSDQDVVAQWLASPPHSAIVLSHSYRAVGIATVCGKDGRLWVVAVYGG